MEFDKNIDIDLADRHSEGIDVTLWWSPSRNETYVTIDDQQDLLLVDVPSPELAMDVFTHPYVYLGNLALQAA